MTSNYNNSDTPPRSPSPEPANGGTRSPSNLEVELIPDMAGGRWVEPRDIELKELSEQEIADGTWTIKQMFEYMCYLEYTHKIKVSEPSICVWVNLLSAEMGMTENLVRNFFNSLGFGDLDHIDMVAPNNRYSGSFECAHLHFKRWNMSYNDPPGTNYRDISSVEDFNLYEVDNEDAIRTRFDLITNNKLTLVYDDPWLWKLSTCDANIHTITLSWGASLIMTPITAFTPRTVAPPQKRSRPSPRRRRLNR